MSDILGNAEAQRNAATGIALEAGVLQHCPIHEDCIFTGSTDIEDAYKLGSARLKRGDETLTRLFSDQKELTDCIQEAVAMLDADECGSCNSAGNS
jgi:hypothetical protein